MGVINAVVKPYHIATLKKNLDRAELNIFFCNIDEQCLINFLEYQNIKRDKRKGTRATKRALGLGCSHTKLNSRRKPTMILSGILRSQEPPKATGQ